MAMTNAQRQKAFRDRQARRIEIARQGLTDVNAKLADNDKPLAAAVRAIATTALEESA